MDDKNLERVEMKRKVGIVIAVISIFVFAMLGIWLEFQDMQSLKWELQNPKWYEGFSWLSNNTREGETVLAWWDYADGIEKIGHRNVVIREASRNIKETIGGMHRYPWSRIEYELWYPFESEESVRDVASFFIAENSSESIKIAKKYDANYVLVVYPDDVWKFPAITVASGKNSTDYVAGNFSFDETERLKEIENRMVVKKETVGIKLIYGDEIDGFEKVFDNERMRIYKFK